MTREQLMSRHPAPVVTTVDSLPPADDVLVEHYGIEMVAHRTVDRRTAACGATTTLRIGAYQLRAMSGRLCRDRCCWPIETSAGSVPAEMEER